MKQIKLYGAIGRDITDSEFINQIPAGNEDLELKINSPGGSVFQGWGIYNALIDYPGKIKIHIDGVAASMASVISLAGDEINMSENALFMIHNPASQVGGNADDLRKEADLLDKIRNIMIDSYHKKTGIAKTELVRMLDKETWFDANEAKENKFIDNIKSVVLTKNNTATGFNPLEIYASFTMPINNFKIISELGMSSDSSEQDILNKIKSLKPQEPTPDHLEKVKKMVNSACIEDRKITADLIPFYESLALKNYDDVKNIFDRIPKITPLSETIRDGGDFTSQDRSKWTLDDYRMKDPKALNNKELFNRLLNNQ